MWRLWKHAREIQQPARRRIALLRLQEIGLRDTSFAPGTDYKLRLPETCRDVDTAALKWQVVTLVSQHPRILKEASSHIHSHLSVARTTVDSVGRRLVNKRRFCREWDPDQPPQ